MGGVKRHRWFLLVAAACLAASVATPVGPERAGAAGRYRSSRTYVGPGIKLRKIFDSRGPNRIRVLVVDPTQQPVMDVALANDSLPGHETTSSMASRHRAVAAINGDFTVLPGLAGAGRPVDTFAEDGWLEASPLIWGRNFSISRNEDSVEFDHERLLTWVTQSDSGETWTVSAVNPVTPDEEGFSAYTPRGGREFSPPRNACSARLVPTGPAAWTSSGDGLVREHHVDKVVCRTRRLARLGGTVVSAPIGSANAGLLQTSLLEGEAVSYGWSMRRPGVMDTIGGNPDLLKDGRYSIGECTSSYFCGRNPRTGVGVRRDGKLLLVTVDGRRPGYSVGMTLWEFADLFTYLGATDALNLDGGGSTTMVVRGRIVNRPSSGYERAVGSSLLVLLHRDEEEFEPTPYLAPTPSPSVPPGPRSSADAAAPVTARLSDESQRLLDPGCQALLDPGSTGGLLDALQRGDLGGPRPASMRGLGWGLRVFRGRESCALRP